MKRKGIALLLCLSLVVCSCSVTPEQKNDEKKTVQTDTDQAAHTPFGKYDELITYTLGKMTGLNNSNMPKTDTYEDNAYTRYLKKKLNIQNKDAFEAAETTDYAETVLLTVTSKNLPDVMVVEDMDTLQFLVENEMIEDLTTAYEECASKRIQEIYSSYGREILDNTTFDGKLMALPETNIDNGPSLLWLRKDWMNQLGLDEPETLEDACRIIQAFIDKNPGKNPSGTTIGLVCDVDLTGGCGYSSEYQTDIVFAAEGAFPKQWIYNKEGRVVYGSVQPEAKKALKRLRKMYQSGILDKNFLVRSSNNIIELIVSGKCGSFF